MTEPWVPGDPIYERHHRYYRDLFETLTLETHGEDAASWPIPHPADDLDLVPL